MAAAPLRTALNDTYPAPSNSVFKTGIGALWDFLTGLLGITGTKEDALTALRILSPDAIHNLSLVPSVATSALTMNVKTRAGAAPSATDPVMVGQRNATLGSGDFNLRTITAALSLVISSGSTLGHTSAVTGVIYWYLLDNAGAQELAASSAWFGESGIASTTAEGGAGAADSAAVMYSATARSNLPFRFIGSTLDTQTTAGTWAALPSTISLKSGLAAGAELAYGQITSGTLTVTATTSAGADTVVSSGAVTYDGTAVYVEFYAPRIGRGTGTINLILYDGATELGFLATTAQAVDGPSMAKRKITPSAGSHTYQVKAYVDAGSGSVTCGSGASGALMPAYCRVVKA